MADATPDVHAPTTNIICKHLVRKGMCYYGNKCIFIHPAEYFTHKPNAVVHIEDNAGKQNHEMAKQTRGVGRRNKVKNSFKCGTFRRWLIDTYGWELFRSKGVLDVAGGKGEMSFELVNLAGFSCTVVDPRPMSLEHATKRWKLGFFFRNEAFNKYNVLSKEEGMNTKPKEPNHLRLFFEPYMWDAELPEAERIKLHQENVQKSKVVAWTDKGLTKTAPGEEVPYQIKKGFEKEKRAQILARRQDKKDMRARYLKEQNEKGEQPPEEEEADENTWDIWMTEESEPTLEVEETLGQPESSGSKNPSPTIDEIEVPTDEVSSQEDDRSWDRVKFLVANCGIVIGMHPDQAAGAIVDFALASGIPFAITPCCVYSEEFTKRRLKNGGRVTTYSDLIQYLVEKDEKHIKIDKLDFEGKNVVVYWDPNSEPS